MSNKIRTGVIGVGSMGKNHVRIYNDISNFVAVSDPNEALGKKIAKQYNVKWYKDYRDMLSVVEAVSIVVPTRYHRSVSEDVIDAGVHLLVEKPLAGNLIDARAIVDKVDNTDLVLSVGHVERYNPIITDAKNNIIEGRWGDTICLSSRRFSGYPQRITDVGVLFDLTIHDVDILRYLANSEATSVFVDGGSYKNKDYEDYINMVIKFENGILGLCQTNWLSPVKTRKLEILTNSKLIQLDYLMRKTIINSSNNSDIKTELQPTSSKEPLLREIEDFLSSISSKDRNPLVTGFDGLKAVNIIEKGLESLNNGTIVNL